MNNGEWNTLSSKHISEIKKNFRSNQARSIMDAEDKWLHNQIDEFGITHSLEYISSLWRKKIPNLIASVAEDDILDWHYLNVEKGKYKRCSRCGQIKLAHNKYFSKNKTSKDGFYSICKVALQYFI